jgi:uncharacterized RDD family membrane protein YckC
MKQPDDAGGREWNPYELATPIVREPAATVPPPLARTPAAGAYTPYAAPRAPLHEAADEGDVVLAGRLPRLLAVLIDAAMAAVPIGFIVFAVFRQMRMSAIGVQGLSTGATTGLVLALVLLAGIGIWNIVLLVQYGQTVGKRFVGIRIARPDGTKAGFWRIFLMRSLLMSLVQRVLGVASPLLALGFVLADVLMIFREDRRCLHDVVADTIVVEAA